MSFTEIIVQGTLNPDGTLELDQRPTMSPGRVTVVLRSQAESTPPPEDWWEYMQRARQELESSGQRFLNAQEMAAWIEELRSDDDRIERAYGQVKKTESEQ
jgi:hypothetical protein